MDAVILKTKVNNIMTEPRYLHCRPLSSLLRFLGYHASVESCRRHLLSIRIWRWSKDKCGRKTSRSSGEYYINRRCRLIPDFRLYHDNDHDDGGSYWMLNVQWLWFQFFKHFLRSKKEVVNKTERDGKLVECRDYEGCTPSWGWVISDAMIHLHWGYHSKLIGLPFVDFIFQKREYLTPDQKTITYTEERGPEIDWKERHEKEAAEKAKVSQVFPYRYTCRDGTVQDVNATVFVDRLTWRRKWTPFHMSRTSIDVHFSSEVGEGKDSWKGGCIGCGYEMQKGENAEQCLRRMEKERKFSR
jgi:hypothetical protein